MTHSAFPAPAPVASFAPPTAPVTASATATPAPSATLVAQAIGHQVADRVGAHRRLVARIIDQSIGGFSLVLAVRAALSCVDQRAYGRQVSIAACGFDTGSNDVQKIATACLDDPSPSHVARFLLGQLPGSIVLLLLVAIAAALLWQWPLVRRGGTVGQRMVDLRHRPEAPPRQIAAVLAWRQLSLVAPWLLFLMGASLWIACASVVAALVEGLATARRLTVSERIVGPIHEAPRRRTSPAPWASPTPATAAALS